MTYNTLYSASFCVEKIEFGVSVVGNDQWYYSKENPPCLSQISNKGGLSYKLASSISDFAGDLSSIYFENATRNAFWPLKMLFPSQDFQKFSPAALTTYDLSTKLMKTIDSKDCWVLLKFNYKKAPLVCPRFLTRGGFLKNNSTDYF